MNMASDYELLSPSLVQSLNRSELILHKLLGRYDTLCKFLACEKTFISQLRPQALSPFPRSKRGGRKETDLGAIMFVFK